MSKAVLWIWILTIACGGGALMLCYYVDRWAERKLERDQLHTWTAHLSKPLPGRWGPRS